jgi:hypothetical protein
MTPSESFDPRTWRSSDAAEEAPVERIANRVPPVGPTQARTRWSGYGLSAALLASGAVAAYATREAPSPAPEPLSAAAAADPG